MRTSSITRSRLNLARVRYDVNSLYSCLFFNSPELFDLCFFPRTPIPASSFSQLQSLQYFNIIPEASHSLQTIFWQEKDTLHS